MEGPKQQYAGDFFFFLQIKSNSEYSQNLLLLFFSKQDFGFHTVAKCVFGHLDCDLKNNN